MDGRLFYSLGTRVKESHILICGESPVLILGIVSLS